MDVSVSTLLAELSSWIDRARAGEEIVITDRGIAVARLLPTFRGLAFLIKRQYGGERQQ